MQGHSRLLWHAWNRARRPSPSNITRTNVLVRTRRMRDALSVRRTQVRIAAHATSTICGRALGIHLHGLWLCNPKLHGEVVPCDHIAHRKLSKPSCAHVNDAGLRSHACMRAILRCLDASSFAFGLGSRFGVVGPGLRCLGMRLASLRCRARGIPGVAEDIPGCGRRLIIGLNQPSLTKLNRYFI